MLQLRVVAPPGHAARARALLAAAPSAENLIALGAVSQEPPGEVLLCDLSPQDADAVIAELQDLGLPFRGSISVQEIQLEVSTRADGDPQAVRGTHDVTWETVEARTSESAQISPSFLVFMALALLIAASGILLNTAILIVGAMIVGPDFGPLAGSCVALLERRFGLAARAILALIVGFATAVVVTIAVVLLMRAGGAIGPTLSETPAHLSSSVAQVAGSPGFFSFFVAFIAGIAGMLSLSTQKSGALIGVLISVTTIPAAANIGLTISYGQWTKALGSFEQLAANIGTILIAGTTTLIVQRLFSRRHRARARNRIASAAGPAAPR